MTWVAAGVVGASVAGTVIGGVMANQRSQGDRDAMMKQYQDAQAQFANLDVPDETKQQLILQSLVQQGTITPQQIQAVQQDPSQMAGIQTDPKLRAAQMQALDTMSKMGQTGLQAQDMAALDASRRATAGDEHAKDQAILQNMAARGQGGSGQELAARLQSSQSSADRANQQSDQIMAMAQNRMLQAAAQGGQLGSQIRGQDYSEKGNAAAAQDAINRFNAQQATGINATNVGALNQAQQANLAAKQSIANANVATANTQDQYNKQLLQQKYNNQLALAGARAGQNQNMGAALGQQANATAGMWQNIGAGVGQAGMGAANMYNSNKQAEANRQSAEDIADMKYGSGAEGAEEAFSDGGVVRENYEKGGHVFGKAEEPGDSPKNDTVKALLSPGEIVIPRSHTVSKDLAKAYLDHLFKVSKGKA